MGWSYFAVVLVVLSVCVALKCVQTTPTGKTDGSSDVTAEDPVAGEVSKPAGCVPDANQEKVLYQNFYINSASRTTPIKWQTDCSSEGQESLSSEISRLEKTFQESQEDTELKLMQVLTAVSILSTMCSEMMRFQEEKLLYFEQLSTWWAVTKQEAAMASNHKNSSVIPRDCSEVLAKGMTSGVYTVQPQDDGGPIDVYCDMETDDGGWTVFQRRHDGSVDFYRDWESYRQGFGDLDGEFWLGNDNLYRLTAQGDCELRVDIADFDGNSAYAVFDTFRIADGSDNYRLTVGGYLGTAGDSLFYHKNQQFSTFDRDNDAVGMNCAERWHGAWWYKECHDSNLNGHYFGPPTVVNTTGVTWYQWRELQISLKSSEMKIKMKK